MVIINYSSWRFHILKLLGSGIHWLILRYICCVNTLASVNIILFREVVECLIELQLLHVLAILYLHVSRNHIVVRGRQLSTDLRIILHVYNVRVRKYELSSLKLAWTSNVGDIPIFEILTTNYLIVLYVLHKVTFDINIRAEVVFRTRIGRTMSFFTVEKISNVNPCRKYSLILKYLILVYCVIFMRFMSCLKYWHGLIH